MFVYLSILFFCFFVHKHGKVTNACDFDLCSLLNYSFPNYSKSKLLTYLKVIVVTNIKDADHYLVVKWKGVSYHTGQSVRGLELSNG